MSIAAQRAPFTVVVGVDFESDGDLGLDAALREAVARGGGQVHAVHVARSLRRSEPPRGDASPNSSGSERLRELLSSLERRCAKHVVRVAPEYIGQRSLRVITHVRIGRAATEIVQLAVNLDADLVVVGTDSRRGFTRLVLGSVADQVTRLAHCPVLVARPKDAEAPAMVEPEIEPPCPECLRIRRESAGEITWCDRHEAARYRPRAHGVSSGRPSVPPAALIRS